MGIDYNCFLFYGIALPESAILGKEHEFEEEREDIWGWMENIFKQDQYDLLECRSACLYDSDHKYGIWIWLKDVCINYDLHHDRPKVVNFQKEMTPDRILKFGQQVKAFAEKYQIDLSDRLEGLIMGQDVG